MVCKEKVAVWSDIRTKHINETHKRKANTM